MHIILSPAKTMAGTSKIKAPAGTTPRFNQEAIEIALHMAQYPAEELGRMLKLSPKLMMESYHRFQNFHSAEEEPLQALLAYTGVVFKNINPKDFTEADFRFAQDHLRLVSICYGLLRPLDLIKPYRMEYDVKLPELGEGNMYIYWRARQTEPLIEEVKADDNLLINLGSMDLQQSDLAGISPSRYIQEALRHIGLDMMLYIRTLWRLVHTEDMGLHRESLRLSLR